jgi:hypothetical protein
LLREAIAIVVVPSCVFVDDAIAVVVEPVLKFHRGWKDAGVVVVAVSILLAEAVSVIVGSRGVIIDGTIAVVIEAVLDFV